MFELQALAKCLQISPGFGSKILQLLTQLAQKEVKYKRSAYSQILGFVLHSTPSLYPHIIINPVFI
jgi:hypothetical protein